MVRFTKEIKNRARRYIELSQRLRTELLLAAFFIFSEMLRSRMDSFCKNGVLDGKSSKIFEICDVSFFEKNDMVDFKREFVERWLMALGLFASFWVSICLSGLKLLFCSMLFCWMLLSWLLFCRWAGLKVLKFWILMFLTSILSVVIFESFTSNSRLVRNITEQITLVCILIQVLINCSFSLLELRPIDFEFSWFNMVFADMAETKIKQVRRKSLYVYILLAYRNDWANGKKIPLF